MNTVAAYEYDGRNYRIEKTAGGVTLDYYYTESWQVAEVHEAGDTANPLEQFVWHPYYIDAAIVRYWDVDTNGSGIAEHYYLHDANFNVTAITDDAAAASVLERYDYTVSAHQNHCMRPARGRGGEVSGPTVGGLGGVVCGRRGRGVLGCGTGGRLRGATLSRCPAAGVRSRWSRPGVD
jgi:hypothetical protein